MKSAFVHLGTALLSACLLAGGSAGAGEPSGPAGFHGAPRQGSVSASGKFTPPSFRDSTNKPILRTRADAESLLKNPLGVEQTGPDAFRIGKVTFDKAARTVSFPARINLRNQVIEYAVVTETGKRHEALFTTEAQPDQIHLACLLLGVTATNISVDFSKPCPVPPSQLVKIDVSWHKNGPDARYPLAQLVLWREPGAAGAPSGPSGAPLTTEGWLYNGSEFGATGFAAQQEGSIISLISDGSALANNPGLDRRDDTGHFPNAALLPAEDKQVVVTLRFAAPSNEGSP